MILTITSTERRIVTLISKDKLDQGLLLIEEWNSKRDKYSDYWDVENITDLAGCFPGNQIIEYIGTRRAVVEISGIWDADSILSVMPIGTKVIGKVSCFSNVKITKATLQLDSTTHPFYCRILK